MRSVQTFRVARNRQVARDTYFLDLEGDTVGLEHPGQFVNVEVPGFYLRRPLSVCNWRPGLLTLMYKVLGEGTEALTEIGEGSELSVLSGLGNGFWLPEGVERPLLVGGGIGVAPLLALTESLVAAGLSPQVILGFGSADEVALVDEINAALPDRVHGPGGPVTVTTVDGSAGIPGFVTDAMGAGVEGSEPVAAGFPVVESWDYVYACGPTPMLRAVFAATNTPGQYSMEERMACGFGACMGCVLPTTEGLQRICKEGPVFASEVLPW